MHKLHSLTLIFTVMLYTLHSFDYYLLLCFRLYRYFVSLILHIVFTYDTFNTLHDTFILYSFLTSTLRSLRLFAALNISSPFDGCMRYELTVLFCIYFVQRYCVCKFHKFFYVFFIKFLLLVGQSFVFSIDCFNAFLSLFKSLHSNIKWSIFWSLFPQEQMGFFINLKRCRYEFVFRGL